MLDCALQRDTAARYGRVETNTVKALASAPRGQETLNWGENAHNRSPLHVAVWYGFVSIVRALLDSKADPNLVKGDGAGSLHVAAYFGSYGYDIERMRQKQRATTKPVSPEDEQIAASEEDCESARFEILQLLLQSGRCIVDLLDDVHGCTPLYYAAGGGWTRAVEALLDAGADVNGGELPLMSSNADRAPLSPLMHAIARGHFETAKLLLTHGARAPMPCEIDSLFSSNQLPGDLAEALFNAQSKAVLVKNGRAHGDIVGHEAVRRCVPVPNDAFAQPPEQEEDERSS